MASVFIQKYQRKKGCSYNIQFRDPITGKKRHYKTFQKAREANHAANELRSMLDSGKIPEPKATKISPLTFSEVSKSLQNEWQGRMECKDLKPKTHYEYNNRLKLLNDEFGKELLCNISPAKIVDYQIKVAKENSNVTSNRSLSVLKKCSNMVLNSERS